MCRRFNYVDWLQARGLTANENRLMILEVIGSNSCPLSAQDIYKTSQRTFAGAIDAIEGRVEGLGKQCPRPGKQQVPTNS